MPIPQDDRPLKIRLREHGKIENGRLMSEVAKEVKKQVGDSSEEAFNIASQIPLDSIRRRGVPLISAYDDVDEEHLNLLAGERDYQEFLLGVAKKRPDFRPGLVVIRPGALIGAVIGTMASVRDSSSWVTRAMYVTAILVALGSYIRATTVKLSTQEGQVALTLYMLTANDSKKSIPVADLLRSLNVQLADYNMPPVQDFLLREHLTNLSILGITRHDAALDSVSLQEKMIEV